MDFSTKADLEQWLLKNNFKRWHEGKDTWYNGKYPQMRFVDLGVEPPWVGIKTGHSSMEYEHGCEDVPLIREKILTIFNAKDIAKNAEKNEIKKSGVQVGEGKIISMPKVIEPPSKPSPEAKKAPDESHEVLLEFTCKGKGCKRKLSKQDADQTYHKYGKALCFDCVKKEEDSQKPTMCFDCGLEINSKQCEEQLRKKVPLDKFRCEDCEEKLNKPAFENTVICPDCGVSLSQERIDQLAEFKVPLGEMDCARCRKRKNQEAIEKKQNKPEPEKEKPDARGPHRIGQPHTENNHEAKKETEGKQKEPEKKEGKTMNENKLTVIPENKVDKPLSDAERDNMIEHAKAKRFLENRGSAYSVQGKERPDSHMIQNIANERNVSIEILDAVQDEKHCFVKVRAHLGEQYVDAVVNHDYEIEYQLKTMEIIKKNPEILDYWDGLKPVLVEGAKIPILDRSGRKTGEESASYYLIHALLSFRKFSMRDARTKASAIASAMILNREWRDPEEQDSENAESSLVKETMNKKV